MLNKAILMGRLTADPELRYTPSGNIPVTTFTLAVNRGFTKPGEQAQTDFIDVVCWRQRAEFVTKYFKKGQMMAVSGSIQTRTWKDKNDNNRKSVEVVADDVYFTESKRETGKGGAPAGGGFDPGPSFPGDAPDFEEMSGDDELPF